MKSTVQYFYKDDLIFGHKDGLGYAFALAANNWDNITVEVIPLKLPIKNTTWNKGLVARKPDDYGSIVIHYSVEGKNFRYTFKATQCGYKYRNQKIKPWES